jgi:hypothetical protein
MERPITKMAAAYFLAGPYKTRPGLASVMPPFSNTI